MKLLCFGDIHLGAGSDYGREYGERLAEQEKVLDRICDIAHEHQPDFVLFAGDAFERRRPTPSEMLAFSNGLRDIENLVGIVGNHDVEAFDRPTALDLFGWYDIVSKPDVWTSWAHRVDGHEKYNHKKLAVARLPWTPVANLVARNGGGDRDELNARAAELLLDTARDLRSQCPDEGPKILLLHWSVSGASLPTGLPTDTLREPVIPLEELEQLGFDAIVAGHIHKAQDLGSETFYVGSPMPLNFGEAHVEHGVWILDINSHSRNGTSITNVTKTFVPIESRPFVTVEADLTSPGTSGLAYVDLGYAEKEQPVDGAIVKVRYKATADQARRVDHAAIRQALLDAGAHRVYAIEPTIEREARARVEGLDEDLTPAAAMQAYAEANEIDEQTANIMQSRTATYLESVV